MKYTADICDSNEKKIDTGEIRILNPVFKPYAKKKLYCWTNINCKGFRRQ